MSCLVIVQQQHLKGQQAFNSSSVEMHPSSFSNNKMTYAAFTDLLFLTMNQIFCLIQVDSTQTLRSFKYKTLLGRFLHKIKKLRSTTSQGECAFHIVVSTLANISLNRQTDLNYYNDQNWCS